MKRTKATKSDTFYIQKNPDNLDADELSKVLELRLSVVNSILEDVKVTKTSPPSQFQMATSNKTAKGRPGVFVMTEGGSQVVDETRQKTPKDTSGFICKVKN